MAATGTLTPEPLLETAIVGTEMRVVVVVVAWRMLKGDIVERNWMCSGQGRGNDEDDEDDGAASRQSAGYRMASSRGDLLAN